ncbi:PAS domain-containing protein [Pedobacter sp. MC2016-14]|uniref:ATP-binding protein n=1 Tax=Pedobacter sp. MC2016-14 TaxID=2897327 RepID=UPI001E53978E|nr:ATP-binding protein [Pedobacter sp. MC2016-14]MCD0487879.1 PAS domain-containing protein [Pedobacter sp. MC2016-14]
MEKLKDTFFRAYFTMNVPRIIVRTDASVYTVISINDSFSRLTGIAEAHASGQSLFDLLKLEKDGTNGQQQLLDSCLAYAIQNNEQTNIPEFETFIISNGLRIQRWWKLELLPVIEVNGSGAYAVISVTDVTEHLLIQKQLDLAKANEQSLQEELAATNEELAAANEELNATIENLRQSQENLQELNNELENKVSLRTADLLLAQAELTSQHILMETILNEVPAGICVLKGAEMNLELVNAKLLQLWKRKKNIIGKPLTEVMPELLDQEFPEILNEVYVTGSPFSKSEAYAELIIDGVKTPVYRDFSYTPIKDNQGNTHSIVALTIDVTGRALARIREQQLMEEQSAINEELSAANEELAATNEELHEAQENQDRLIAVLARSEARFRNLIIEAPVAICVLKGTDYVIDAVNDEGLKILNKQSDIIGKSLRAALSEQERRPLQELLKMVSRSGETYYGNEVRAQFESDGQPEDGYFNFIFKPVKTSQDSIEEVIIVATNVTDLVNARNEKESAEVKLGLAIEAARMGSWYINAATNALEYNPTLAVLFGYEGSEPMTYEQAISRVTDDYRQKLEWEIEQAITHGGVYDMTYTMRRFNDEKIIWLRSLGKIHQDNQGNYTIFSGVVMDITEQKQDEQRKNDFIGMVSHELKTPLTSLNGYAQILHSKAKKQEDSFAINVLSKVTDQVKRMTTLINGFLNISRLESGKIHLVLQEFYLDELVRENIEEAELLSTAHEIIFKPCAPVLVKADRDKIGSVISNMISNAIKYSPNGIKKIEIQCQTTASAAQISVKDFGMGIAAADIPKLFDRFYRVESNQMHLISGFGIGLYLCSEIINHHHGKIWVESEPDQGSTFHFSLPLN